MRYKLQIRVKFLKFLIKNLVLSDTSFMTVIQNIEEYRPFGTLSNIDIFDYTAKLRYGWGLGPVSHKKRAKTVW